jgi:hypothetical protein
MILSLAVLHVRYQRDKYMDLLCPLPSHMWWCYTGLPPLSVPAKKKRDQVMSPPPPPPRWAGGGGGRTGKSAHVEWRSEQKILALMWQGRGSSTRCTTASASLISSADLKSETRKVKVVDNAYLLSISC